MQRCVKCNVSVATAILSSKADVLLYDCHLLLNTFQLGFMESQGGEWMTKHDYNVSMSACASFVAHN